MAKGKVIIGGGDGFIGRGLVRALVASGYEPVVLARHLHAATSVREVQWDGKTVGPWAKELDGATAVINLAGASITKHWTEENKLIILQSRLESTAALGKAISESDPAPKAWVNASAVGYYGGRGDTVLTEEADPGRKGEFLVDTCVAWEHEVDRAPTPATRKIRMRNGIVLGRGGGAFEPLHKLTKFFLGGSAGNGLQYMSWIHLKDVCGLYIWAIENDLEGPLNVTAPEPAQNVYFMEMMRAVMHRPWAPPAPAFLLKFIAALGGPEASLLLQSQRAVPQAALDKGFNFEFPRLREALIDLVV